MSLPSLRQGRGNELTSSRSSQINGGSLSKPHHQSTSSNPGHQPAPTTSSRWPHSLGSEPITKLPSQSNVSDTQSLHLPNIRARHSQSTTASASFAAPSLSTERQSISKLGGAGSSIEVTAQILFPSASPEVVSTLNDVFASNTKRHSGDYTSNPSTTDLLNSHASSNTKSRSSISAILAPSEMDATKDWVMRLRNALHRSEDAKSRYGLSVRLSFTQLYATIPRYYHNFPFVSIYCYTSSIDPVTPCIHYYLY